MSQLLLFVYVCSTKNETETRNSNITKNKALYRVGAGYQTKGVLRERPIIRLEDGSHVCPENDSGDLQVYLPPKGHSKFKTVKRALLEAEESYEFLKSLGLEEPNNIAEIKESFRIYPNADMLT